MRTTIEQRLSKGLPRAVGFEAQRLEPHALLRGREVATETMPELRGVDEKLEPQVTSALMSCGNITTTEKRVSRPRNPSTANCMNATPTRPLATLTT